MCFYVHQLKQCFLSEVHLNQNNPLPGSAALRIWQMTTITVMNQDISPFLRGHCSRFLQLMSMKKNKKI